MNNFFHSFFAKWGHFSGKTKVPSAGNTRRERGNVTQISGGEGRGAMQREREAGIERPGMKRRRAGKGGVSTSPFLPLLDQTPFHGRADTSPTEYGNHQGLVRPEEKTNIALSACALNET